MYFNVHNIPVAYKCAYMGDYPVRNSVSKTVMCPSKYLLIGRIGFKLIGRTGQIDIPVLFK